MSGLTALTTLECSENLLTSLNLQGCNALQELYCSSNKLTSLNVKDCTALKRLECDQNKLDATAMTKLLTDLPTYQGNNTAHATLYTEETGKKEGNCKDFNNPPDLKTAFEGAKAKHWTFDKKVDNDYQEIT